MGFVCPKIHFIDVVGERPCHKSIEPNSLPLILFISNLLQKNWKTGEWWMETNTSGVGFSPATSLRTSFSRENKEEDRSELIPSQECPFRLPPQVAQFGQGATGRDKDLFPMMA